MTTVTHSELDDTRREVEAKPYMMRRPEEVIALLDHIAQLTAERNEQRDIVAKIWVQLGSPTYEELQGRSIYDLIDDLKVRIGQMTAELTCRDSLIKDHLGKIMHLENRVDAESFRAETAEARMTDFENQPSAQASDDDVDRVAKALCESDGCCWEDVADTNAIVMSQSWDGSLTSKEDYRHDARAAIAAMSKPSAQFVAGMRRAAEMLDVPRAELLLHAGEMTAQESRTVYAVLKWRATAILAEAALKGK